MMLALKILTKLLRHIVPSKAKPPMIIDLVCSAKGKARTRVAGR